MEEEKDRGDKDEGNERYDTQNEDEDENDNQNEKMKTWNNNFNNY